MKAPGIVIDQEVSVEGSSEDLDISDILYDGDVSSDESANEEDSDEESDESGGSVNDSDADESFDSEFYL